MNNTADRNKKSDHRLQGKRALITGGTTGIGLAIVRLFAQHGARVILTARSVGRGKAVEDELRGQGLSVSFVPADVTNEDDCRRLFRIISMDYGGLDILVNNAGVSRYKPFEEMTIADFDAVMDLNMRSVFMLCQSAVSIMRAQHGGSIVNVCSIGGMRGNPFLTGYNASKGAVRNFTKGLAAAVAADGIRVNALMPGTTRTDMTGSNHDFLRKAAQYIPMGRVADPKEIAFGVLFLASDESSFMTGAELVLDGGITSTIIYR